MVRRLRGAGAVVVGITRVPELCVYGTTDSTYGITHNPWDLDRSPGGSSGGSAAAVASGTVPVAHGNDGMGSIRIPSACCGLVGIKPGLGVVPADLGDGSWFGMAENGPLATTVDDAALMLSVLASRPELADPGRHRLPARCRLHPGARPDPAQPVVAGRSHHERGPAPQGGAPRGRGAPALRPGAGPLRGGPVGGGHRARRPRPRRPVPAPAARTPAGSARPCRTGRRVPTRERTRQVAREGRALLRRPRRPADPDARPATTSSQGVGRQGLAGEHRIQRVLRTLRSPVERRGLACHVGAHRHRLRRERHWPYSWSGRPEASRPCSPSRDSWRPRSPGGGSPPRSRTTERREPALRPAGPGGRGPWPGCRRQPSSTTAANRCATGRRRPRGSRRPDRSSRAPAPRGCRGGRPLP